MAQMHKQNLVKGSAEKFVTFSVKKGVCDLQTDDWCGMFSYKLDLVTPGEHRSTQHPLPSGVQKLIVSPHHYNMHVEVNVKI